MAVQLCKLKKVVIFNKSEDIWICEGWENDTCGAGLWTIDLEWKYTAWEVPGDGRITHIDDGTVGQGATICNDEHETGSDVKVV